MSKRYPDNQKREAKRSLWHLDGEHSNKKYRSKGRGRGQDKELIREEVERLEVEPQEALNDMLNEEADEAHYCHYFGPCGRCLARFEDDQE